MTEPTPIAVPDGLAGLAGARPEVIAALRDARVAIEQAGDLDERTIELTRVAALVALDAPPESVTAHVRRARGAGATAAEVWDVVANLATIVGVPRLIATVPRVAAALEEGEVDG